MKLEAISKKLKTIVVILTILGIAALAAAAQHPNCPLNITGVSGDVGAFTVTNLDSATLSVTPVAESEAVWGTVVLATNVNSAVVISPVVDGTKNVVLITASKVDSTQAANFTIVATNTFGHTVTISATADCPADSHGCTLTQGYWKTHANQWPVQSVTLGTVTYTKTQAISILNTPVKGNGLIALSYQLIAAKVNIAAGASAPASVTSAIAAADALIGSRVVPPIGTGTLSTDSTSGLVTTLDGYNNGLSVGGPPHCDY